MSEQEADTFGRLQELESFLRWLDIQVAGIDEEQLIRTELDRRINSLKEDMEWLTQEEE